MNDPSGAAGVRWVCDVTSVCVGLSSFWNAVPTIAGLVSIIYCAVMIWTTLKGGKPNG